MFLSTFQGLDQSSYFTRGFARSARFTRFTRFTPGYCLARFQRSLRGVHNIQQSQKTEKLKTEN
jgi:hypothetical protein